MTQFSSDAWNRNLPIFHNILEMPFHWELGVGTLANERFRHYMIQDAHDLDGFARALSLELAKGLSADHVVHLAWAAQAAVIVERSLHSQYFQAFGITPGDFAAAETSPVC
jgi:thiaminase/transcriptional activator TenA